VALLSQVPALEHRVRLLGQPGDGRRPAVDQQRHHRFAGGDQRLDQRILVPVEAERAAVSRADGRLARDLGIVTDDEEDDVGARGDPDQSVAFAVT
jgi:hypothetical protein